VVLAHHQKIRISLINGSRGFDCVKYTILGFQQEKLIESKLSIEDAFILRTIKDLYSSATMEFITIDNDRLMWVNYSYLLEQIPIVGSKRNLMRRIESYSNNFLIVRMLKKQRNGIRGNFSYIAPTEKLDRLQDFDLMTKSHKGYDKIAQGLGQNGIRVMTKSHNKDTSISDTSIIDTKELSSIKITDDVSDYQFLSDELVKLILSNNKKARIPTSFIKWNTDFRYMIKRDNRSVDEIRSVMVFSQEDQFWKANILSPKKLREKFDTLFLQKGRSNGGTRNNTSKITADLPEGERDWGFNRTGK
jgi:hypothetical protein